MDRKLYLTKPDKAIQSKHRHRGDRGKRPSADVFLNSLNIKYSTWNFAIRTLRCDDSDGHENVKKAIRF